MAVKYIFRRAWIKDEYHRIFGDEQDGNFPKTTRPSTSLPPAPSTRSTSSYNVPSATNFTEREKNIIEDQIFEEFQSPRPSGAYEYPQKDPVRPARPVTGNTKPDTKKSSIADHLLGTVSMSAGKGPFRATVFSNPKSLSKIGSIVDDSLHGVRSKWNSMEDGAPKQSPSKSDPFKSRW